MIEYSGIKISYLGHDCFKLTKDKVIYIDPFQLKSGIVFEKADCILVSHEHQDHCSINDIKKLTKKDTVIITVELCKGALSGKVDVKEIKYVKPNEKVMIDGISVEAVIAYNTTKFRSPGNPFHPKKDERIGFVINWDGVKIYHTGDTDNIDEMKTLKDIDVLLIPVSGTYVMTADEAAEACKVINPKLAIPMHYGAIVGSESDAIKFKGLVSCRVEILKKE